MMGTIKIELDLPDFDKEIELRVLINKDGVQKCTSSISNENEVPWIKTPIENPSPSININRDLPNITSQINTDTKSYNNQNTVKIPSSMMGNY